MLYFEKDNLLRKRLKRFLMRTSKVRISKALNVDRVPPPDDDSQDGARLGSSGHDRQAFIDEFDLMISNQDIIQF